MQREGLKWTRSVVANLENDRRPDVSVAEMFALAQIFEVSPLALLLPESEDVAYQVTARVSSSASAVYQWLVGERLPPLPAAGDFSFNTEERAAALRVFRRMISYTPDEKRERLLPVLAPLVDDILRERGYIPRGGEPNDQEEKGKDEGGAG